MKDNQTYINNNIEEDSIDILAILKNIWRNRKFIVKATGCFFVIGCLVSLLSPVKYTSQTTFVPQVSSNDIPKNNKLGSIASLAGINLVPSEVTTESYLSPLLYSKLLESEEFSYDIINEEIINLNGDKLTIKEYLLTSKRSLNFNPVGFIKGLFKNNIKENNSEPFKGFNFLSDNDYSLVQSFKEKFTIELNEKQGYIIVKATDKSAFVSAQLVEVVTKNLQLKIIELRTNKIKERLEFSNEQYEIKQNEFDFLQKKLAEFKDSNKNISTARFMSELQKLESEYQLQQNILINLASEYNNNKIKLNKDTPIFSVIDEVSIPNQRSEPKRSFLVSIYVFFGLMLSVSFVIAKDPVKNLIKEIKN